MLYKYLELVRDALYVARRAVLETLLNNRQGFLGRGFFGDLTSEADKAAEEAIIKLVKERLPGATIISEEAGIKRGGSPTILVDPLDGSTNAIRGLPVYSTSIAIAPGNEPRMTDIVAAGVIDHCKNTIYWGYRDAVYKDWVLVRSSTRASLRESIVCFNTQLAKARPEDLNPVINLMRSTKYPRMLGAAALEIALVASGSVDAYIAHYSGLRTFDCLPSIFLALSAGAVLASKARGLVNTPLDTMDRLSFIVAANDRLANEVLGRLNLKDVEIIRKENIP